MLIGHIESLFLHAEKKRGLMRPVEQLNFIAGKGIEGNTRYFDTGKGNGSREVSILECQLANAHQIFLNDEKLLPPGRSKSNMEIRMIKDLKKKIH